MYNFIAPYVRMYQCSCVIHILLLLARFDYVNEQRILIIIASQNTYNKTTGIRSILLSITGLFLGIMLKSIIQRNPSYPDPAYPGTSVIRTANLTPKIKMVSIKGKRRRSILMLEMN